MKLIKRKVIVHGDKEIYIIIPYDICLRITGEHDNKGFLVIYGDGSGYEFLRECFSIAAELQKNEIFYIPSSNQSIEGLIDTYQGYEYRHHYSMVLMNYCETQLSMKKIEQLLETSIWTDEIIYRNPNMKTEFINSWKHDKRLTVKLHKKNMYITTNRDGFYHLSMGADQLAGYGDDYKNDFLAHVHFDSNENTASSLGLTLYYWNDKSIS